MADVDEIIDYIKSLKKGFDIDLFQNKIDELAYAVDTTGILYNDFHTLFKVWLNLSIPITKWISLGACLVPQNIVEDRTVEYALSWMLSNYEDQSTFSRIGFLLDWLTAAMECECIEMETLDMGYDVFYVSLTYETLTPHAVKLVYTLTKPVDVTRRRVLELLDYARKREAKKNMFRQLQVLLGLFKSYKPECVPEDIPAISIHTAFKKINPDLLARFKRNQENRNSVRRERHHLTWINPINSDRGRNKKVDPLVPNVEFLNIGSKQYAEKEHQKNFLDFTEFPEYITTQLCREAGSAAPFSGITTYSDAGYTSHHKIPGSVPALVEREGFLRRDNGTGTVGEPGQSRSRDVFGGAPCEGLPQGPAYRTVRHTQKSQPNVYASTRKRHHFMGTPPSPQVYAQVLPKVATAISDMCDKELQVNPEQMVVVHSSVQGAAVRARGEARGAAPAGALAPALALALPLLGVSAALLDSVAELMILYKKIFTTAKQSNLIIKSDTFEKQMQVLEAYTSDLINCLYSEGVLSDRNLGFVFSKLHPQLVEKLGSLMPDVDAKLSIRNSIAFAPYTYIQLDAIDHRDADNKLWFNAVIEQEFSNLSRFLKRAVTELRYQ
ncbi:hypothetical protein HF086_010422 [Spodoptera exigua]|uniref:Uncharacterized protein n=1 Tax=Spodoptera exigua TaxID=7107 RepID=A0A922SML3_SPOEX|nr:hypothetical protein HF086_010422 [Spodoptera exigua]